MASLKTHNLSCSHPSSGASNLEQFCKIEDDAMEHICGGLSDAERAGMAIVTFGVSEASFADRYKQYGIDARKINAQDAWKLIGPNPDKYLIKKYRFDHGDLTELRIDWNKQTARPESEISPDMIRFYSWR